MITLGRWNVDDRATATANTAFNAPIFPFAPGGARVPSGIIAKGVAQVDTLAYLAGATAHDIVLQRPLNYVTMQAAAASQATVVLNQDPGLYSTSYNFPKANGVVPGQIADNAIAASDLCMLQLADGTWMVNKVASGTFASLVFTTNFPVAIAAGGLCYFFGVTTDKDPSTGLKPYSSEMTASVVTVFRNSDWCCSKPAMNSCRYCVWNAVSAMMAPQ